MKLKDYLDKHGNVEVNESELNKLLGIKESKVWKPESGETFYYITYGDDIQSSIWVDNLECHSFLYKIGNCFKTIEQAEFMVERLKVIDEVMRYAQEHNEWDVDWKNSEQAKYDIYYDIENNIIDYCSYYGMKFNDIYFTSRKIAEQAVETVGYDRVKKYYLRIND